MRRSLGAVLIVLGVLCVLLAFCLDAGGKPEGGPVSDVSHAVRQGDGSLSAVRQRTVPCLTVMTELFPQPGRGCGKRIWNRNQPMKPIGLTVSPL